MDNLEFLRAFHGELPADYGIETKTTAGNKQLGFLSTFQSLPNAEKVDTLFGVLPRRVNGTGIDRGFCVWLDSDGNLDDPAVEPQPSAAIHTGRVNGFHIYWRLDREETADRCAQISRLAAVAFDGDAHWCTPSFMGRLPNTTNSKYTPTRRTKLMFFDQSLRYDPEKLEEMFVAKIFEDYYTEGERHTLTLSLAGMLIRASWSLDRALRCIRYLYDLNPGTDLQGKLAAVTTTYTRHELGEPISTAKVRAVLTKEKFIDFITGLGITSRDGDLLVDGEVIGKALHIEREMVNHILSMGNWGFIQGKLARWEDTHWRVTDEAELSGEVFSLLSTAKYIVKGELQDFPATSKTSRAVSGMTNGTLIKYPLPDPEPYLLPLINGTLDLRSRKLLPSLRDQHHTWRIEIEYQPKVRSSVWENFIKEAVPDDVLRKHLQEWMGYFLLAGNKWERMLWLFGPSGTGKSTYIKGIEILLGPAGMALNTGHINDYTIAQLSGKRAALCGEISPKLLHTSTIKSLIAGDPVQARHPYGRPFTVVFDGKFAWGSNALPPLDQGEGMWRRIVPVEFSVKPKEKDDLLKSKLAEPEQAAGLLNWALDGLARLDECGDWPVPEKVSKTVREYQLATDTMTLFAEEWLERDEGFSVPVIEVYKRYSSWVTDRGFKISPLGPIFFQDARKAGLEIDTTPRPKPGLWFKGGMLRPELFDDSAAYQKLQIGAN